MRQRREVAACAQRALLRYHRVNAAIEKLPEQLECLRIRARVTLDQAVQAHGHDRPDDLIRKERATAGGVTAYEVVLQLALVLRWDHDMDQVAKSSIDAVDGIFGFAPLLDPLVGLLHLVELALIKLHRLLMKGDGIDVING